MYYGKLIDENLYFAPKCITINDCLVFNPTAEQLAPLDYFPVVFTEAPEAPTGYYYENNWEKQNDKIVQIWILTKLPDNIDSDEALAILLGGDIQ